MRAESSQRGSASSRHRRPLTNDDRQAEEDELTIKRVEAQIFDASYEKVSADYFDDAYAARDPVAQRLAREPREDHSK